MTVKLEEIPQFQLANRWMREDEKITNNTFQDIRKQIYGNESDRQNPEIVPLVACNKLQMVQLCPSANWDGTQAPLRSFLTPTWHHVGRRRKVYRAVDLHPVDGKVRELALLLPKDDETDLEKRWRQIKQETVRLIYLQGCPFLPERHPMQAVGLLLTWAGEPMDACRDRNNFSARNVRVIMHSIATGVAFLHKKGCVYRSITSAHICLRWCSETDISSAVLVDMGNTFGFTRDIPANIHPYEPSALPLEEITAEYTESFYKLCPAGDTYALGVLFLDSLDRYCGQFLQKKEQMLFVDFAAWRSWRQNGIRALFDEVAEKMVSLGLISVPDFWKRMVAEDVNNRPAAAEVADFYNREQGDWPPTPLSSALTSTSFSFLASSINSEQCRETRL